MRIPFFRRDPAADTISTLYGTIVAQARLPCFYREYAVADTVNGRFDLLVLHLSLVVGRFMREEALRGLGQGLFDRFCRDMDHNLREMGISDLKVPKEMRRMGEAFYGRAQAYQAALEASEAGALAAALSRNIYGGTPPDPVAPERLASYIRGVALELDGQTAEGLGTGQLHLPDPTAVPAPAV